MGLFSKHELLAKTFTKGKTHLISFQYHFTGISYSFVPFTQEKFYEKTFDYTGSDLIQ